MRHFSAAAALAACMAIPAFGDAAFGVGMDLSYDVTYSSILAPTSCVALRFLIDPAEYVKIEPTIGFAAVKADDPADSLPDIERSAAVTAGLGVFAAIPLKQGSLIIGPEYEYDRLRVEFTANEGGPGESVSKDWINRHAIGLVLGAELPLSDQFCVALHVRTGATFANSLHDIVSGIRVKETGFSVRPALVVKWYLF